MTHMNTLSVRSIRSVAFVLLVGLACACGDEPQRLSRSEPAPVSPHGTPSESMPAPAPPASTTVRLAGRVHLTGSLKEAQKGAVFLIAKSGGRTALVHKYEMSGPSWSNEGDARVLRFSLTDQDNMAGAGAPVGTKMDLEALYEPDGFVDIKPDPTKQGVARASTSATTGDTQISITLKPSDAAPQPPAKPSGG